MSLIVTSNERTIHLRKRTAFFFFLRHLNIKTEKNYLFLKVLHLCHVKSGFITN